MFVRPTSELMRRRCASASPPRRREPRSRSRSPRQKETKQSEDDSYPTSPCDSTDSELRIFVYSAIRQQEQCRGTLYFESHGLHPLYSVMAWRDTHWTMEELEKLSSPSYAVFLQVCPRTMFLDVYTLAVRCEHRPMGRVCSPLPPLPFGDVCAGEVWTAAVRTAELSIDVSDLDRIACCAGALDDSGHLPKMVVTGEKQCLVLNGAFQTASLARILRLFRVAADAGLEATIDPHARCIMRKV